MRNGQVVLVRIDKIKPVLDMTHLVDTIPKASDLTAAFKIISGESVELTELQFAERFVVQLEGKHRDMKVLVPDKDEDRSKSVESPVGEVPPQSQERLSIRGMAGVALSALAVLGLMILGLVWVTKQVSSIPLLVLIFCVALLFSLCLIGLLLLLSGHLSEKMTVKLLDGVLAKIPSLGRWVPTVLAKKVRI
jgi:hypothetical protein